MAFVLAGLLVLGIGFSRVYLRSSLAQRRARRLVPGQRLGARGLDCAAPRFPAQARTTSKRAAGENSQQIKLRRRDGARRRMERILIIRNLGADENLSSKRCETLICETPARLGFPHRSMSTLLERGVTGSNIRGRQPQSSIVRAQDGRVLWLAGSALAVVAAMSAAPALLAADVDAAAAAATTAAETGPCRIDPVETPDFGRRVEKKLVVTRTGATAIATAPARRT